MMHSQHKQTRQKVEIPQDNKRMHDVLLSVGGEEEEEE